MDVQTAPAKLVQHLNTIKEANWWGRVDKPARLTVIWIDKLGETVTLSWVKWALNWQFVYFTKQKKMT